MPAQTFLHRMRFPDCQNRGYLEFGKRALRFIEAPMVHWPDSMFDYLEGEGTPFLMTPLASIMPLPGVLAVKSVLTR